MAKPNPLLKQELNELSFRYLVAGAKVILSINMVMLLISGFLIHELPWIILTGKIAIAVLMGAVLSTTSRIANYPRQAGFVIFSLVMAVDLLILSRASGSLVPISALIYAADMSVAAMALLWPLLTTIAFLGLHLVAQLLLVFGRNHLMHLASDTAFGYMILPVAVIASAMIAVRYYSVKSLLEHKLELMRNNEWMSEQNRIIAEKTHEVQKSNNRLKEFAYLVSHDLKAPLRGVKNLAAWIREDNGAQLSGSSQMHLDLMDKQIHRMEDLIRDILDYAKNQSDREKTEWIRLDDLVRQVIEMVDAEKSARFTIDLQVPEICGTRIVISQVLQNLLSNSIRHNDKEIPEIKIQAREEGKSVCFTVSDNGPGIDPALHKGLFDLFKSVNTATADDSTGIGLSAARKMVEDAGGSIWFESETGAGSKFHFMLPAAG